MSLLDDLALLEIEGSVSDFLRLLSRDLNTSNNLYTLGYLGGEFKEIRQIGIKKNEGFFTSDKYNVGGVSGSPVLNEFHQLVGVLFQAYSNILFFIRGQKLKSFIETEDFLCRNLNFKKCFQSSIEVFEESIQEVKEAIDYYKIADIYYNGFQVEKNLSRAIELWRQSAFQGHAPSQSNLAWRYYKGEGEAKK